MERDSRDYTCDRRAFRQVKRLFMLAGIIEAEGSCTAKEAAELFARRIGEGVSDRQIRRDLLLLAELGVLEEEFVQSRTTQANVQFRYKFEGWPLAIH